MMTEESIYRRIAEQADRTPDRIAIVAEERDLTYREVVDRADAVCEILVSAGLQEEDTVAVFMSRKAELIGTLLGIWKAGGAYVPIDPGEKADRVRRMIAVSNSRFLLGDKELCAPVLSDEEAEQPPFIDVAGIPDRPGAEGGGADRSRARNLAYLFFTSGSTGEPKGVEIEHISVIKLLEASRDLLNVTDADRYLASSTYSFDISVVELFLPLTLGGCVVFRDKSILLDPAGLASLVKDTGITIVQAGPSVWSLVLNAIPDFPRLRIAISTGEAVTPEIAMRIAGIADQAWNLYGPTETTVWVTGCDLTNQADMATRTAVPIGFAFTGATTMVAGDDLKSVPDGEQGELLVGGDCVARGYRNREALTAEKFITIGEERYYRTGDLVMRDPDGNFEYYGRIDEQMSIRGIRVEPGEIEVALRSDPLVKDAAVTWFQSQSDSRSIVAAIVLEEQESCTSEQLYDSLKGKLPSTLIPTKFIFVPWLPINKNGKVDRASIRSAAGNTGPLAPAAPAPAPKAPDSQTYLTIADVWKRMFRLEKIAPDAHFFAIGGDSLAAVTMTHEIEARLGVTLPAQLALETPTLGKFAERVEGFQTSPEQPQKSKFLFPMVEEPGTRPVFFCGGNLSLVRRWKVPCSLYFIAYWSEGGDFVAGDTIEEVAANCLKAMQEHQPSGPYRIAGYSFGGILAFEIAQQLVRIGEEVEFLFLLDPYKPHIASSGAQQISSGCQQAGAAAAGLEPHKRRGTFNLKKSLANSRSFSERLFMLTEKVPGGIALANWVSDFHGKRPNAVSKALVAGWQWPLYWFEAKKKLQKYHPQPYAGKTIAIFSETQSGKRLWSSLLAGPTQIEMVSLEHHQLFKHPENETWLPLLEAQVDEKT